MRERTEARNSEHPNNIWTRACTYSWTGYSPHLQVKKKRELQTLYKALSIVICYSPLHPPSPLTLLNSQKKKKKMWDGAFVGGGLNKFYILKAAYIVIAASPKTFFSLFRSFAPLLFFSENTFLAEWAPISDSIMEAEHFNGSWL